MKRLAIAAAWLIGCAPIASLAPTHLDRQISSRTVERVRDEGLVGRATQDGTMLQVSASRACDLVEQRSVDRTTRVEHQNRAKWLDASIGVAALAAVGTGTWLMVDASNVHEDDKTSRTYNPTGPSRAFAYGAATAAGGVALLSIPIIDTVRAHRVEASTARVTVDGAVKESSFACSNSPATNTEVHLQISDHLVTVGMTNAQGTTAIDILAALHPDLSPQVLRGQVPVLVGTDQVGTFDLQEVYDSREAAAWNSVDAESCRNPTLPSACDNAIAFASKWTHGRHVTEANSMIANARSELDRLREERAWGETDLKACSSPNSDEPAEIERACRAIEGNYLRAFPTGAHADSARSAIEKGLAQATDIRDRLAAQRARQAAQEERRGELAAIKVCRSRCKIGCSSWRIRDEGMCLVGCLEQCGGE